MGIKIGDTREIDLLDSINDENAINFKVGNKFAELTENIVKTKGSPQLKFTNLSNNKEYYIREKFNFYEGQLTVGFYTALVIFSVYNFLGISPTHYTKINQKVEGSLFPLVFDYNQDIKGVEIKDFQAWMKPVMEGVTFNFTINLSKKIPNFQLVILNEIFDLEWVASDAYGEAYAIKGGDIVEDLYNELDTIKGQTINVAFKEKEA